MDDNSFDEDSFLKRLLTIHLFNTILLPIVIQSILTVGFFLLLGIAVVHSIYSSYHDTKIRNLFNQENFTKVMLIEETAFASREVAPNFKKVTVFEGKDSAAKAKQWLKDNEYWNEEDAHWLKRDIIFHKHLSNEIIHDKDYPPNHIVNTTNVEFQETRFLILFEEKNYFSKNRAFLNINGRIWSETETGYAEYIEYIRKTPAEELEKEYKNVFLE